MKDTNTYLVRPEKAEALNMIIQRVNEYGILFSDADVTIILEDVINAMKNLADNKDDRPIH